MNEQITDREVRRGRRPALVAALFGGMGILVLLLALRSGNHFAVSIADADTAPIVAADSKGQPSASSFQRGRWARAGETGQSSEQIVSNRVAQFARSRRDIAHALARRANIEVPAEVEQYFAAVEAGRWEEAKAMFDAWIAERRERTGDEPLTISQEVWPAIFEAHGVTEIAQRWPADKLLEYGEAVLGSLRPGMVYVGGTDPGRYIPTLLNETSDGERHVVLTQNALADGTYLKYVEFLHGDRLQTLTSDDSQNAFRDYIDDAKDRLANNQLRPGEDVKMVDNRIQVSGQVAVMDINERLLNAIMVKNPDLSFALEESFPLKSTYEGALPLGPIFELNASKDPPQQEQIAASLNRWRALAQDVSGDTPNSEVRKTYSHMAQAQGNLFSERGFTAEAEQTWQLAREMCPANSEAVGALYRLWQNDGRSTQAESMLDNFMRNHPEQSKTAEMIRATGGIVLSGK